MPPGAVRKVDPDVLEGFLEEAQGYLPSIRAGIAALADRCARKSETEHRDPVSDFGFRILNFERSEAGLIPVEPPPWEAHRQAHCIKGAAAMVGLAGLSRMAGQLEEALEELVAAEAPVAGHALPLLQQAVDLIESYLDSTREGHLDEDVLVGQADELFTRLKEQSGLPAENSEPSLSMDGVDSELLAVFDQETQEHLRIINQLLPSLLEQPGDREALQDIRRSVHTLKGSAAMIGLPELTRLAHRMEDLLDLLGDGQRASTPEATALLVTATDALEELASGTAPPTLAGLYQRFEQFLAGTGESEEQQAELLPARIAAIPGAPPMLGTEPPPRIDKYVRVPLERLDELTRLVSELVIARTVLEQRLCTCMGQFEELQRSTQRLERSTRDLETRYEVPALASVTSEARTGLPVPAQLALERGTDCQSVLPHTAFDELELDRYTEFHQLSRALTETSADIGAVASDLGKLHGELESALTQQAHLSSEIQDRLTRLRLVPFAHLAGRLQRTVRGVAQAQKKDIHLVLEGETTELDKLALEELSEPLLHLLRNAADHGIEAAETRRQRGKSETGTIRIRARQESNQVVLEISDDGGGIDPEAVRRTALASLTGEGKEGCAADFENMTDDELLALVFQPGFSTARRVSEVSGRGVGLDIVKTRVERLKGTVSLASQLGEGTTFTIRLPVPLALMKALLVRCAGQTFALPLAAIVQIGRLHVDAEEHGSAMIQLGEVLAPRIDLAEALRLARTEEPVDRPPVLIVNSAGRHLALVADSLVEAREVVVKGLGRQPWSTSATGRTGVPCVAGATVLGDGSVILILNPDGLGQPVAKSRAGTPASAVPVRVVAQNAAAPAATILVVDDSPSVRRVMTRLLAGVGWKVLSAREGLEALELLQRTRPLPDLMLVDVEMPRMDGYQLVASVKGDAALAHIPAVMVTSRASAKHRGRAEEVGASGFVTKPYQDDQLLGIIRRLLEEARIPG